MSEAQRKKAEQAQQEAKLSAEKFEKVFQATEPKQPQAPTGRRPEDIPHREIPVENLERRVEPQPKPQKKGRTLRDAIRERYGGPSRGYRQPPHVKSSRGSPVYPKGRPFESSGRISTELTPAKAERLALIRERVRAVQNRRELSKLEKLYRRFRAQNPRDPELRP
ncbi:MAG TPA: hypothetical protein VF910_07705 [Candidatus Bathyarchaeia archaeon]